MIQYNILLWSLNIFQSDWTHPWIQDTTSPTSWKRLDSFTPDHCFKITRSQAFPMCTTDALINGCCSPVCVVSSTMCQLNIFKLDSRHHKSNKLDTVRKLHPGPLLQNESKRAPSVPCTYVYIPWAQHGWLIFSIKIKQQQHITIEYIVIWTFLSLAIYNIAIRVQSNTIYCYKVSIFCN